MIGTMALTMSLLLAPQHRGSRSTVAKPGSDAATPALPTETPIRSSVFLDTFGLNVHLHNDNTLYGNFPLIHAALTDLGIQHIRDGLILTTWPEYYRRHAVLAAEGIHCDFISGVGETDEKILTFLRRMNGSAEALEAPNEYDATGGPDWAAKLQAFMPQLYAFSKSSQLPKPLPVYGPSMTRAGTYLDILPVIPDFDDINMHNYFGGWNPGTPGWADHGYGSIHWNMEGAVHAWGNKPIVTTETGYNTDLTEPQGIPEDVEAQYVPRVFFEQALHGIQRTYLYELADGNAAVDKQERTFGLLRADGSRKPSFVALERLTALLHAGGTGERAVIPVPVQFRGDSPLLHHMVLESGDGSLLMAFWVEAAGYNPATKQRKDVPAVPMILRTARANAAAELLSLDPGAPAGGQKVRTNKHGELSLTAGGAVQIVRFAPAS